MKKLFLFFIVIIILIGSALVLTGCDISLDDFENETKNKETKEESDTIQKLSDFDLMHYGEKIDFGISNNGKDYSWKIMYNDKLNNKFYAIMSDYLPNKDIENANNMKMNLSANGFTVSWNKTINNSSEKPEVKDNIEAATTLANEDNWNYLIPKILNGKAIAKGAPTLDEFKKAVEYKSNSLNLYYYDNDKANGYWLATAFSNSESDICSAYPFHQEISQDSMVWKNTNGLRPILIIDSDIKIVKSDDIWKME